MGAEHEGYVRRVQEDTQPYSDGLLAENERLRAENAMLAATQQALRAEVETLHAALRRHDRARLDLEARLKDMEDETRRFAREYSDGGGLELVRSAGIDAGPFRRIAPYQGVIGRVARDGHTHVTERDGLEGARAEEAQLTACVPLKLRGRVMAVLALFRLLPQKTRFESLDQELFDLLADQAAMALYCTSLHRRFAVQAQ